MNSFSDGLPFLSVYPYALYYYLILVAASFLAYLAIRRAEHAAQSDAVWSLQIALLVIFFAQLILLSLSLLAYQNNSVIIQIFPIVQRSLTLISLIWLTVALTASSYKKLNRLAPLLLTLPVVLLGSLALPYWAERSATETFNGSWLDLAWTFASLAILGIGLVLALLRKQQRKFEAIAVLVIAALGLGLHLLMPAAGSQPGAVMLSQLLYYPLLISIAWQIQANAAGTALKGAFKAPDPSPQLAASLLDLGLAKDLDKICEALTHSIALLVLSDLTGIVESDDSGRILRVTHMYDLIREEFLPPFELSTKNCPCLYAHFDDGRPLRANKTTAIQAEIDQIMAATAYNQIGKLLLYPLRQNADRQPFALLCLSAYTERLWSEQDLERLSVIASRVEQILQNAHQIDALSRAADSQRMTQNQTEREKRKLAQELDTNQHLLDELRQASMRDKESYAAEVQLWAQRQERIEAEIEQLNAIIKARQAALADAAQLKQQKIALEASLGAQMRTVAKLRAALENASAILDQGEAPLEDLDAASASSMKASAEESVLAGKKAAATLEESLEKIAAEYSQKKISLSTSIHDLPTLPESTVNETQEILECLATNAFSASPDAAEVSIGVRFEDSDPAQPALVLLAKDQGCGLSDADQSEFLHCISSPQASLPEGIGDASALQRAIDLVQQAGGHWWVYSQLGAGTTYRVSLPISAPTKPEDEAAA